MRLDWIRAQPWVLAAIAGALAGLVGGGASAPVVSATRSEADAKWTLPAAASIQRRYDAETAQLRRSTVFFQGAAAAARPSWRLVGVTAEGDKRIALILVDGRSDLLRVGNGDPLPDDGQVVDVGRYGMRINIYGCQNLILRLFTPGQRSPAPGCGYADAGSVAVGARVQAGVNSKRTYFRRSPGSRATERNASARPPAIQAVRPAPRPSGQAEQPFSERRPASNSSRTPVPVNR